MTSASDWERTVDDLRSSDIERAVQAIDVLDRIADATNVPDLYRLLRDDDFFVREAAAVPLARIEGATALPALFEALDQGTLQGQDNDGLVATVSDLLEDNPRGAAPLLLRMISASAWKDREHAAWALGFLPPEVALQPLLTASRDESPQVRASAAGSLASFEGDSVLAALLECLTDEDSQVRASAASSLGYLGDQRSVPVLRKALTDPDEAVREIAAEAIDELR